MFISLLLVNSLRDGFKLIKQMAGVRPLTKEDKEVISLYGKPITLYGILQAFTQDKVCIIFLYFSYNIFYSNSEVRTILLHLQAFIIFMQPLFLPRCLSYKIQARKNKMYESLLRY